MLAPAPLRGLLAAFVFLTRLPMGRRAYRPADWDWASAWFPFVGLVLGGLQAGLWLGLGALGPLSRAGLVVAFGMLLTGAFHEDGLADTADALGGAHDRPKLFEILKDSRLGTFGVSALVLSLLLRVSLLSELGSLAPLGLLLSGSLGRTLPLWLMVALPYVTPTGAKSKPLVGAGIAQLLLGSLLGLAPLGAALRLGLLGLPWATALPVLLVLLALLCGWRFRARAGGLTGDFLGAAEQLAELLVLGALAAAAGG